jgi:hypothetical protein
MGKAKMIPRQVTLGELVPNTMDVVEPKAKKKYKTKGK